MLSSLNNLRIYEINNIKFNPHIPLYYKEGPAMVGPNRQEMFLDLQASR